MIATLSLALAFAADRFSPEADVRAYSATTSSWRKLHRAAPTSVTRAARAIPCVRPKKLGARASHA